MKTVYSLGCSFMSDDVRYPAEPSFVQRFAQNNNYEYHCLARPGATNFAINLQVDRAIKRAADLIVIGCTSSDRLNVVNREMHYNGALELDHIIYSNYDCSSENEVDNTSGYIASDTVANLLESQYVQLSATKLQAVKHYVAELHNEKLQYHIDLCVMRDSVNKLIQSNIPFVFIPGPQSLNRWRWLGNRLWTKTQPWDIPCGTSLIWNHNTPEAHKMFAQTLEEMVL